MSTSSSIGVVSLAALLQIIIQFLIQRVIAGIFGADEQADCLAAALALPTVLTAIITGSLSYGLIPEMVRSMGGTSATAEANTLEDKLLTRDATGQEMPVGGQSSLPTCSSHAAQRTASFVGLCTLLVSGLGTAGLAWLAWPICQLFYSDLPTTQLAVVSKLLQILSWQVLLGGLISWLMALHHSRQRFIWPALGGVCGTALTLIMASQIQPEQIELLAWSINAGSLLSVAVQLLPILSWLRSPAMEAAAIRRLGGILVPLLLGAAILRLDPLVDRILAAQLDEGAIAYIHYAQRMLAALLAIGTSSLAIVAFPQLAGELADNGERGFAEHFAIAFRRLLLIVIPVTLGFGCFALWIIRDLLQHGAFTAEDSRMVGWLTILHLGMFAGASCAELLARGFYVLGDSRTPTIIGVAALALSWVAKLLMFSWIGIWGIALGVSCYCVLSACGMAWWLTGRCGTSLWSETGQTALQALLASGLACALSWLAYQLVPHGTWLAALVGAAAYFVTLIGLKNRDAIAVRQIISQRLMGA